MICQHTIEDSSPCGAYADTDRVVEGVTIPLCFDHAAEVDYAEHGPTIEFAPDGAALIAAYQRASRRLGWKRSVCGLSVYGDAS